MRKTIELSPDYAQIRYALSIALTGAGEPETALSELELESDQTLQLAGQAMAYHALGNSMQSDKAVQALTGSVAGNNQLLIAQIFAFRNENDESFKWIADGIENDDWRVAELHTSILFKNLHDDPRWNAVLEKLGQSPAQLAAIKFEVVLPE